MCTSFTLIELTCWSSTQEKASSFVYNTHTHIQRHTYITKRVCIFCFNKANLHKAHSFVQKAMWGWSVLLFICAIHIYKATSEVVFKFWEPLGAYKQTAIKSEGKLMPPIATEQHDYG